MRRASVRHWLDLAGVTCSKSWLRIYSLSFRRACAAKTPEVECALLSGLPGVKSVRERYAIDMAVVDGPAGERNRFGGRGGESEVVIIVSKA